jgi:NAD(P)-dependent dehydrogenase (short-subunit alcohol dehydrogenase family)
MYTRHFSAKIVVITGGARGLGRGLAEALARSGARVVMGDIDFAAAEKQALLPAA